MTGIVRYADALTSSIKKKSEEINLKRKMDQEAALPSLNRMKVSTHATLQKTWSIQQACVQLEQENKRFRTDVTSELNKSDNEQGDEQSQGRE